MHSLRTAYLHTGAAVYALAFIHQDLAIVPPLQCFLRTIGNACAAANAFAFFIGDLFFEALRLRIGAPRAAQRTAFEEHQVTNVWAIMNGETLNVEYSSC